MQIQYQTYDGIPGRYFNCASHKATLTEVRCTTMFQEAKRIQLGNAHRLEKCIGCPIGALHAGEEVLQRSRPLFPTRMCVRCHEPASRLVCGGICVSCHNRAAEVLRGRNAKGVPPTPVERFFAEPQAVKGKGKTVALYQVEVAVVRGGKVRIERVDRAANVLEVMLRTVRTVRDDIAFAWKPPARIPVQPSSWGAR